MNPLDTTTYLLQVFAAMYSFTDAILNMVNNIAANVLGGNPEDGAQSGGKSILTILQLQMLER